MDDNPDTGRMVWSWTYGCERFFTVWGDDDMQKKVAAAKRVYQLWLWCEGFNAVLCEAHDEEELADWFFHHYWFMETRPHRQIRLLFLPTML